ncbi:DUF1073 domain-containing protein [Serratia ureilytica]
MTTATGIPVENPLQPHHSFRRRHAALPADADRERLGQSVVERIFDRLMAFDSATTGAAQLVYKRTCEPIR